ncbi:MAG: 16S rRNA (guanine(527)-N(7))-methyltransferase RsmG [Tissierellia bacterium]|nr:16S rRNA (guanine(527)-N(7))-methyltransferase RsmG [Tissierellia bacterium]
MNWDQLNEGLKAWGIQLDYDAEKFNQFANLVLSANETMNLTRITDQEEMVEKHFLDSLSLYRLPQFRGGEKYMDLGTGGGFPGMVLALTLPPESEILLMDSLRKRIAFLQGVIDTMGVENAVALHARAEELARDGKYREQYDVVVSRAVARLDTLLEYAMGFVAVGGTFIAMKGQDGQRELKEAKQALKLLHGEVVAVDEFELPGGDQRSLIVIEKTRALEEKYPRGGGKPRKSPL